MASLTRRVGHQAATGQRLLSGSSRYAVNTYPACFCPRNTGICGSKVDGYDDPAFLHRIALRPGRSFATVLHNDFDTTGSLASVLRRISGFSS